jgi:citrate synthase
MRSECRKSPPTHPDSRAGAGSARLAPPLPTSSIHPSIRPHHRRLEERSPHGGNRTSSRRRPRPRAAHRRGLDPGYGNTGSCQSAITFIDGEKGILRYRGIPIEELAEQSTFIESSYLLIYGHLPSATELEAFSRSITFHTMVHEDFKRFFNSLPKDTHPMAACSAAVGALSAFYPDSLDPRDARQIEVSVHRLIAKMPTMAAYA